MADLPHTPTTPTEQALAVTDSDLRSSRLGRRRTADRWIRAVFGLLVGLAVVVLWVRSFKRTDVLAVYTRAGAIQGVMSHRGRVVFAASSLSFGPEKALTADRATEATPKGEELYDLVYKSWPGRREWYGFGMATSARGDLPENATHVALVAPHWSLAAAAASPMAFRLVGLLRRVRRKRRGWCVHCGYDLHGSTRPCPECGEAVVPGTGAGTRRDYRRAGRSAANILETVAFVAAGSSRAEREP